MPCIDCTKAIISVGVKEVYTFIPQDESTWKDNFEMSKKLFNEANINNIILNVCGWNDKDLNLTSSFGGRKRKTRKQSKKLIDINRDILL